MRDMVRERLRQPLQEIVMPIQLLIVDYDTYGISCAHALNEIDKIY